MSEASGPRQAEREIFEALHQALPAHEYALHTNVDWLALGHERPGRAAGEADVILCHPRKGVLVLEVKGGGLELTDGKWSSVDRNGARHGIKDPMKQAQAAAIHLIERFKNDPILTHGHGRFPLPIGFGVILPHVRWKKELPLNWQAEIVIDQGDLRDAHCAVEAAFDYWLGRFPPRGALETPQWRHLNARISPSVTKVPTLAAVIEEEERELVDLTNQQARAMQMMQLFERLKVQGCAGSGKTMLAVEEARRLAAEGKHVLLLCFNKLLAAHLRDVVAESPRITATGFHQLCWDICNEVNVEPTDPGDGGADYWRTHLPETAFAHLEEYPRRWDALVVDEGQDFRADWWAMLELLMKPAARMVVFYDPNQDIFHIDGSIPIDGPPATLTQNCRSTAAINRAARAVGEVTFPSDDGPVPGEPPEVLGFGDAQDLKAQVKARVTQLIDDQGLASSDLVVLSPRRLESGSFAGEARLGRFELVQQAAEQAQEVRFSTLQAFKGLEANVVLLVDVDLDSSSCSPQNLYVGFSRAKHRLVAWVKADQRDRLAALIEGAGD